MDLQTVFYTLGIIFMSLSILILVGLFILVFFLWRKISQFQTMIEEKIEDIKSRPAEIAGELGAAMVDKAVKKAKSFLQS